MEIKELWLFENYKIIVFDGKAPKIYYTVKDGYVCYSEINKNANSIESNFHNNRIDVHNKKMLGKVSELTEQKCKKIFTEARYLKEKYPDFLKGESNVLDSALESIKSFLQSEKWSYDYDRTWIIVPTPKKKLTGHSVDIEFNIIDEDFNKIVTTTLPVYFSEINSKTKEIKYSVEIPDHVYDFMMLHPELNKRPVSKVYQDVVFSKVISYIENLNYQCRDLKNFDKQERLAKKYILVYFNSSKTSQRDTYQFGYAGENTIIKFQYFVGYTFKDAYDKDWICVDKRHEAGKGFVEIPKTQRRVFLSSGGYSSFKKIEWTQEREDFLAKIEEGFDKLRNMLNGYLSDIDANKLDMLLKNEVKLLG